jgi:TolB-like protein
MKNKEIFVLAGAVAALLAAAGARADGFKKMARDLVADAKRSGVSRVAVMPFEPADGSVSRDGWNISEKLVTQLVRTGKVQTLERSMLKTLLDEHQLGRTGALDPASLRKLGKVLSAEGIITGSFVTIGREVVVNARLINVETGVIVSASERRAPRDWFDAATFPGPVEAAVAAAPAPMRMEPGLDFRDSVSDVQGCANAATTVDKLEEEILDLKARYWALKLKGRDMASLARSSSRVISDPELKLALFDKVTAYARDGAPALTAAETKKLVAVDGRAFTLAQKCGI